MNQALIQALESWANAQEWPRCGQSWPKSADEDAAEAVLCRREANGDGWLRHNAARMGYDYLSDEAVAKRAAAAKAVWARADAINAASQRKYEAQQAARRASREAEKQRRAETTRQIAPLAPRDELVVGSRHRASVPYRLARETSGMAYIAGNVLVMLNDPSGDVSDGAEVVITAVRSGKAYRRHYSAIVALV